MADIVIPSIRGGVVEKFADADHLTFWLNSSAAPVVGGRLVESVTGKDRRVQPAAANSNRVAGVAGHDQAVTDGEVQINAEGVYMITASGAIAAGDRLVADTAGKVKAAGAAPDARQIVGRALADAADTAECAVALMIS